MTETQPHVPAWKQKFRNKGFEDMKYKSRDGNIFAFVYFRRLKYDPDLPKGQRWKGDMSYMNR